MNPWITPDQAVESIRKGRGQGVRIAVLDSGIDTSHKVFKGFKLLDDIAIVQQGKKLVAVPGEGRDPFGHGTAVAGIIHEMAPEAEIGSIRVLGEALLSKTATILEGARQAIQRGYHILNCSLGAGVPEHVSLFKTWVDSAFVNGVHVVAACNNSDYKRPEWPAFFSSVLTVNMVRTDHPQKIYYKPGHLVELAAHGVNVDVAWTGGATKKMTGSSFAAPRVTGMLACLLGEVPGIDPLQAKLLFRRLALPWTPEITAPNERPE